MEIKEKIIPIIRIVSINSAFLFLEYSAFFSYTMCYHFKYRKKRYKHQANRKISRKTSIHNLCRRIFVFLDESNMQSNKIKSNRHKVKFLPFFDFCSVITFFEYDLLCCWYLLFLLTVTQETF